MTRRCSHCSNNGHNSRTCPARAGGVRLFGVRLTDGSIMKKSASMGNLSTVAMNQLHHQHSPSSAVGSPNRYSPISDHARHVSSEGYLSDDPAHGSGSGNRRGERKKGVPWTEEEHRIFLLGLNRLGKGDWRGIARNYVTSRTPTQVASHAQKYFMRQSNVNRRKKRSSLFDMVPEDMLVETSTAPEEVSLGEREPENASSQPSLSLSLKTESQPMEVSPLEPAASSGETIPQSTSYIPVVPGLYSFWPVDAEPYRPKETNGPEMAQHNVLKPVPVVAKAPVNMDQLVGMSVLSIGETERGQREPSPLSLKLVGESSRRSAFHTSTPVNRSDLSKGESTVVQAS